MHKCIDCGTKVSRLDAKRCRECYTKYINDMKQPKEEPQKVGKVDREELYSQVFTIFNDTINKYKSGLKPVTCLTNYTKNKKIETANLVISDMHIGKLNKIYILPYKEK